MPRPLRRALPAQSHSSQIRRLPRSHRLVDNTCRAVFPMDGRIQALRAAKVCARFCFNDQIVLPQLDPLTEQQVAGICSLQQSCHQAEEALSQGLEQFLQSLADTVTGDSLVESSSTGNYMGQMAIALGKLANLEGFVRQADNLRQQTLHQMHRILTIRQAARCFLAIGEYHSRLRALSSLWASRPRE
ncbi:hypothetical protein MUK42_19686 [Musa troglodytarum]|uniref:DOG1 domain-containing protein n=1 Tax=Musa troglodytarum TaxID=320322 RepID=A0A9E7F564_9LILI|nr:hypothetical protein MUK42_19686 [Musa troglodytarum]